MWEPNKLKTVRWSPAPDSDVNGALHRLLADDEVLANAIELTPWGSNDILQLTICEHCGFEGCEIGGYISLRRSGDLVLLCPQFDHWIDDEDDQHAPPWWMKSRGVAVLDGHRFAALREIVTTHCHRFDFPSIEEIEPLRSSEAVELLLFEAPESLVVQWWQRKVPGLQAFAGVSDGSLKTQLEVLAGLMSDLGSRETPVVLRPLHESERILTFFIEAPGYPEWSPLATDSESARFHFTPGLVVEGRDGA